LNLPFLLHQNFIRATVLALSSVLMVTTSTQAHGQPQSVRATFTGTVKDPTNAIIPGAKVELTRGDGVLLATGVTDGSGRFGLAQPRPGDYTLTVTLDGFAKLTRPVHIGAGVTQAMVVILQLASVTTSVTVNAGDDLPLVSPENNQDAATVSADDMKNLPVFDADIVQTLSAFLSADVAGEGGPTLMIDGVESKTVGVAPSAIERVSINQDPYSAQYRQPGRGQVEIITRKVAEHYHGSASFTFRDSSLNAANYFATSKASDQRRIYEGYLTGPLPLLAKMGFLFSVTRKESDAYQQVVPVTLPVAMPAENVAATIRTTNLTMKVSHPYNEHHSAYLLYRFYDGSQQNQNVGGQVEATAGYSTHNLDMDLTYHDDLTISANKLNQFNLQFERNLDSTISAVRAPQVVVQGVATFGGAEADAYNTENNPNFSDIFSWTVAKGKPQEIKFGIQIPNLGRRIIEDKTNRDGTYTYASAAAYPATPSTFSIQQGQERFETLFVQPSAFFMDQVKMTPRLTVVPGLRYDFQNVFSGTKDGVEPHFSVAYVLDEKHGMVVRAGGAAYIRRVGANVGQQIARYQNAAERSLLITTNASACYPVATSCTQQTQPPSLFELAPGMQSPVQGYFGMSVERALTKKSTVTVGYEGLRGWHALRSIDINAPLPPFASAARPNPNYAQIAQLNSGGYQKSDALNVSWRGRVSDVFAGFLQYTYSHADSNTQWSTFFPENQYAPNAEWSRTDFDERQQVSMFGTFYPEKPVTLGVGFYANTPLPYTITTGTDAYQTGLFNARPAGVARNSVNGGGNEDVELRLGYTRKLHPRVKDDPAAIAMSVSTFNTLNHPNFTSYVGVVTSPEFGQPTAASSPRRIQLAVSYTF